MTIRLGLLHTTHQDADERFLIPPPSWWRTDRIKMKKN